MMSAVGLSKQVKYYHFLSKTKGQLDTASKNSTVHWPHLLYIQIRVFLYADNNIALVMFPFFRHILRNCIHERGIALFQSSKIVMHILRKLPKMNDSVISLNI